jgi:serine/threonine protein kinase
MQYINSGSFGSVVKAYDTHEECEVAIKCILRGQAVTTYVEQEIINHRMLVHPHIVRFKEVRTHGLLYVRHHASALVTYKCTFSTAGDADKSLLMHRHGLRGGW